MRRVEDAYELQLRNGHLREVWMGQGLSVLENEVIGGYKVVECGDIDGHIGRK